MNQLGDLLARIPRILSATEGVLGASYFGSVAKGSTDRFSDIDLVVHASMDAGWDVVRRLHQELTIVLFRPFSEDRRPSGRYWFAHTNPFARLDVSFFEAEEYAALLARGRGVAQPPFRALMLEGPVGPPVADVVLPTWSESEFRAAGLLRTFQEVAKGEAREHWIISTPGDVQREFEAYWDAGRLPMAVQLYRSSVEVLNRSV
ncbi:MAG: nucleotidyltransferase domain-containing protein [Longimicrobiales bacterium]